VPTNVMMPYKAAVSFWPFHTWGCQFWFALKQVRAIFTKFVPFSIWHDVTNLCFNSAVILLKYFHVSMNYLCCNFLSLRIVKGITCVSLVCCMTAMTTVLTWCENFLKCFKVENLEGSFSALTIPPPLIQVNEQHDTLKFIQCKITAFIQTFGKYHACM